MSDPNDEMRRLKVTDALFDEINPDVASKIIEGIEQKDSLALMFQELRVMRRELGSEMDTLMAANATKQSTEVTPAATEQRRRLGLRYSGLALAVRLIAKHIADGGQNVGIDLYGPSS